MKAVCIKQFMSKADEVLICKHNRMKISICKIYELYKQKSPKYMDTYILSELPITDDGLFSENLLRNLNSWTNITKKELRENFRIIKE
jgi:hypothetical protein